MNKIIIKTNKDTATFTTGNTFKNSKKHFWGCNPNISYLKRTVCCLQIWFMPQ